MPVGSSSACQVQYGISNIDGVICAGRKARVCHDVAVLKTLFQCVVNFACVMVHF